MVWVIIMIMRRWGVSSEHRRSSCSSCTLVQVDFTHIIQGYITGIGATLKNVGEYIVWIPYNPWWCQITIYKKTKYTKIVCIFDLWGILWSAAVYSFAPILSTRRTQTERSSGWLLWSSLGTLKLAFNVSSDDQDSHLDDFSISASFLTNCV